MLYYSHCGVMALINRVDKMTAYSNGFNYFRVAILQVTQRHLEVWQAENYEEYSVGFGNILFDRPEPEQVNRNISPQENAFSKIWEGYHEIELSFSALHDVVIYIKNFPPKKTQISKSRFLRYHVENYFNEIYLLRERIMAYPKVITRLYKNDPRLSTMSTQIKMIGELPSALDSIVYVRGRHVHQARFDDEVFGRLDLLELLLQSEGPTVARVIYPSAVREARKRWISIFNDVNTQVLRILDPLFGVLHQIIFDEQGKWIPPYQ